MYRQIHVPGKIKQSLFIRLQIYTGKRNYLIFTSPYFLQAILKSIIYILLGSAAFTSYPDIQVFRAQINVRLGYIETFLGYNCTACIICF